MCQKRFTLKHSMMRHRRKHTPAELAEAATAVTTSPAPSEVSEEEETNEGRCHSSCII